MPAAKQARPRIHFSARSGWINDPNGLHFDGQRYHLYAQHNPFDKVWGPMHWLHASSEDLLHWREEGIALWPDQLGTMFSGCVVIDHRNTAGFGAGARVAVFTQHGEVECQSIAWSTDGHHYQLYEANPVIDNPGIKDFRDPKVFWYAPLNRWLMVLSAGDHIRFYQSEDLKRWVQCGSCCHGLSDGVLECPDLLPLTGPDGREHWVLMLSIGGREDKGGGRQVYLLGRFDGNSFYPDGEPPVLHAVDAGFDHYAGTSFHGTAEPLYMAWAANPLYAGQVPAKDYRGCLSLPRRLRLQDTAAGLRLQQEPVLPRFTWHQAAQGEQLHQDYLGIQLVADGPFALSLTSAAGDSLQISLSADQVLSVDRSRVGGRDFHAAFATEAFSVSRTRRLQGGRLQLQLILDQQLLEVFADQGLYAGNYLLYPAAPFDALSWQGELSVRLGSPI